MSQDLFEKIIVQLADIGYTGTITLQRYGEPLLDDRLATFVKFIKDKVPGSKVHIYTNGDLLTSVRFRALVAAGVGFFMVTAHDDILGESLRELESSTSEEEKLLYRIRLRRDLALHNRAGILAIGRQDKSFQPCDAVSRDMEIDSHGRVLLCCNDYYSTVILGNVTERSLRDIWRDKQSRFYRRELARGHRSKFAMCRECNM